MSNYTTDDVEELKAKIVRLCLGCIVFGFVTGFIAGRVL